MVKRATGPFFGACVKALRHLCHMASFRSKGPRHKATVSRSSLSPVFKVDDVGPLQACLKEVAQLLVVGRGPRLRAAVLHPG